MNKYLLSFDCTSDLFSVALFVIEQTKFSSISLIQSHEEVSSHQHSERLVFVADEIMKKNQISYKDLAYAACSIGPGSFTGIRVGLSYAKMLRVAIKIPVFGFNCCEIIASQVQKYNVANQHYQNCEVISLGHWHDQKHARNIDLQQSQKNGQEILKKNSKIKFVKILSLLPSNSEDLFAAIYYFSGSGLKEYKAPFIARRHDVKSLIDDETLICTTKNLNEQISEILKEVKFENGVDPEFLSRIENHIVNADAVARLAISRINIGKYEEDLSACYIKSPSVTKRKIGRD